VHLQVQGCFCGAAGSLNPIDQSLLKAKGHTVVIIYRGSYLVS